MPEETVRRRYAKGVRNFFSLYRPLADSWTVYDNSDLDGMRRVATVSGNEMKIAPEKLKTLLLSEAEAVDRAARRAVREALLAHKRAWRSVPAWRNGEVVIIPPEQIEVDGSQ